MPLPDIEVKCIAVNAVNEAGRRMDRETRFKEAFKTGLSLALVYGIALYFDWMNPFWAGWAVALISLSTVGQSLHKGLLRVAGTVPGCVAALIILGLAPQNRWCFYLLAAGWVFFTTYMMLSDKRHAYFWNVAGFVCLIILMAGPGSFENAFLHAVFRTLETILGVVVYTLVSVFLWPRTNAGAIRQASGALVDTQAQLFTAVATSPVSGTPAEQDTGALRAQQAQQLQQFAQALEAEGSESYEVHELRDQWRHLHGVCGALMEAMDRWAINLGQVSHLDLPSLFPGVRAFADGIGGRFELIQQRLQGGKAAGPISKLALTADGEALRGLSVFDRAAVALVREDLERIEALTRSVYQCAAELTASSVVKPVPAAGAGSTGLWVPDLDNLRGAAYVALTGCVGFLIWIYLDPPGHAGWAQFPVNIAMAVAGMQQMKTTLLVRPIGLGFLLGLVVYVFIMPQLSGFVGLGSLLFLCMFLNCYCFDGIARLAGTVAILMGISVTNPQTYHFAAMANSLVFTVMGFYFVFLMSYLLNSSRPEKALLHLVHRYFRSLRYLVARLQAPGAAGNALGQHWLAAFYRYEMKTLPNKIAVWGRSIDPALFPATSPQRLQALVSSLQMLTYRVDALLEAGEGQHSTAILTATSAELRPWLGSLEAAFSTWSTRPEALADDGLRQALARGLDEVEGRLEALLAPVDGGSVSEAEAEQFLLLLGGLRGVSEAVVVYAGAARDIDWAQWREERFS